MYQCTADEAGFEEFAARIQRYSDEDLIKTAKAARSLASNPMSKIPSVWLGQLELCREEWRRRYPRTAGEEGPNSANQQPGPGETTALPSA